MPVKFELIYFRQWTPFHWANQHVAARVTNMAGPGVYDVEYGFWGNNSSGDLKQYFENKSCNTGVITLYSPLDYGTFRQTFITFENARDQQCYNPVTNNCATTVEEAMRILFQDASSINQSYTWFRLLCCLPCVATLGCCLFPAAPGFSTPRDVFNIAYWLSHTDYGQIPDANTTKNKLVKVEVSTIQPADEKLPLMLLSPGSSHDKEAASLNSPVSVLNVTIFVQPPGTPTNNEEKGNTVTAVENPAASQTSRLVARRKSLGTTAD